MKMFPPTKFINENTLYKQIQHIKSEVQEVEEEYMKLQTCINPLRKAIILHNLKLEVIDVKHSSDTLLHKLGVTEEENMRLSNEAIKKNYDRGYYKND